MRPELDNFPAIQVAEIWPAVLRAVQREVSRRRSEGAQVPPGPFVQPAEDQFLRDAMGVTRTKLAQDGTFSDFFEDEIEAIFRDAPVPRMGVATRARDSGSFVALDAAAQGCAPLGSLYCIVLIAVRRREYQQSEGRRLLQVVRDLVPEAFFAFGICPDDSLPHDTVRVSILTA